eukprot:2183486-Rhodomonas_salina.1
MPGTDTKLRAASTAVRPPLSRLMRRPLHKAQCPLCKKDVREDWEDEGEELWDPVAGAWMPVNGRAGAGASASEPPAPDPPAAGDGEDDA